MQNPEFNSRLSNLRSDYLEFVNGILDKSVDKEVDDKTLFQRCCLRSLLLYYSEHDRKPCETDAIHISGTGAVSVFGSRADSATNDGLTISFSEATIARDLPSISEGSTGFIVSPLIALSWNVLKHIQFSLSPVDLDELCRHFRSTSDLPSKNSTRFEDYLRRLHVNLKSAPPISSEALNRDKEEGFKRATRWFPIMLIGAIAMFVGMLYFGYLILRKVFS